MVKAIQDKDKVIVFMLSPYSLTDKMLLKKDLFYCLDKDIAEMLIEKKIAISKEKQINKKSFENKMMKIKYED